MNNEDNMSIENNQENDEPIEAFMKLDYDEGFLKIILKYDTHVSIVPLNVPLLFASYWRRDEPIIESFLNTFEKALKRGVNEILPDHKIITIDYNIKTNDTLEASNKIEIIFNELWIDDLGFEIKGDILAFDNEHDKRKLFKKITSFRRKLDENVRKNI